MRDVHEPHDAEDERESDREQRVEPAEQHALQDGVDPSDHGTPPESDVGVRDQTPK